MSSKRRTLPVYHATLILVLKHPSTSDTTHLAERVQEKGEGTFMPVQISPQGLLLTKRIPPALPCCSKRHRQTTNTASRTPTELRHSAGPLGTKNSIKKSPGDYLVVQNAPPPSSTPLLSQFFEGDYRVFRIMSFKVAPQV